jgi:hypothetical protein
MKSNLCDNLLRRSVENQFLAYRHNRRENEMLEEKFSLYQRQIRLVNHHIHMAERRCEQHARNDLGLVITCKRKPIELSKHHRLYYPSTKKNWTMKDYVVETHRDVVEHKNLYECAFGHHSRYYRDKLQRQTQSHVLRKQEFLEQTNEFIRDDQSNDNDRCRMNRCVRFELFGIDSNKSNRSSTKYFPIEL